MQQVFCGPGVSVWLPHPPPGYVSVGYVAVRGTDPPPLTSVGCLHQHVVVQASVGQVRRCAKGVAWWWLSEGGLMHKRGCMCVGVGVYYTKHPCTTQPHPCITQPTLVYTTHPCITQNTLVCTTGPCTTGIGVCCMEQW